MNPQHRPYSLDRSHSHSHAGEHSHSHASHPPPPKGRLFYCLILTAAIMVLEIIGGLYSKSLALLSDAGHMATDLFALTSSFLALRLALKPADSQKTYGYFRAEILAAFLNSLLLIGIAFFIGYEAVTRFFTPEPIRPGWMFWIALIGLGINLLTTFFLRSVHQHNLNLKGAYLHVLSDTLSSLAVVVGSVVIWKTNWLWIDPLLSLILTFLILFLSFRLLKDSIHILMESTPKHLKISELENTLTQLIPEVQGLHDVHVWEITSNMYAMTAHVIVHEMSVSQTMKLTEKIQEIALKEFQIEHVNLQYEL